MAEVVLGIGTSHSPMLNATVAEWSLFEPREASLKLLDRDGRATTYEALLAQAAGRFDAEVGPAHFARKHAAAQAALDRLAGEIRAARLDALVVFGDDQRELFHEDNLPALMVYTGKSIAHRRRAPKKEWVDWFAAVQGRYYPAGDGAEYPCDERLARHLAGSLGARFDPAICERLPRGEGIGHAFAFVYQRLQVGVPIVPVFINTYYPPNQPGPRRCLELGEAVRAAIESFAQASRVGVLGSGGLSHFAIDAQLDQRVVQALRAQDASALAGLPVEKLNSGSSEIRNWIAMAGAAGHLPLAWAEYIPAYRTPAGTGTGLCFAALARQQTSARA
jgi:3-O-methylgallate 3,4-dioxygenase